MAMAQFSSSTVTKSLGEGAVFGVFFPPDNALYSIVFGTHTKMAELIEMPFGIMTWVLCVRWGILSPGAGAIFWGKCSSAL